MKRNESTTANLLDVDDLIRWMHDSDPALAWQVERDVMGQDPVVWEATRERIATQGYGARLLALQDEDGQWAGGAFFPRDFDFGGPEAERGAGQPWTATTWTLNALREWGLDASHLAGTAERLEQNSRWDYDDLPYWGGEVDCCINAYTLANGAWLGADVDRLLDWFAEHQMADGGWNCDWVEGSTRSSFHSTLNSMNGLLYYEDSTGRSTRRLREPAEEFLLERDLHKKKSTGQPVDTWVARFTYPFRWSYNVMRAAEYFRMASTVDGPNHDPRMSDAIDQIRAQRRPDGRWLQGKREPGRVWFEVDVEEGQPSKWLTLFGARILDWWDAA